MISEQVNAPELLLADHLPEVLDDELPCAERLFGANAPAFALCTKPLQTLDPVVFLDSLVVTVVATRTSGGALGKAHPSKVNKRNQIDSLDLHPLFTLLKMFYLFRQSSRQPFSVLSS